MMSICTSREGNLSIFESSNTRYPLLSRCSSCFTKKSEFVLSFLLILIVPRLSICVIYTSSSNLVAQRASSLSSKQGTRSLLSSATWTNHRPPGRSLQRSSLQPLILLKATSLGTMGRCKIQIVTGPAGSGKSTYVSSSDLSPPSHYLFSSLSSHSHFTFPLLMAWSVPSNSRALRHTRAAPEAQGSHCQSRSSRGKLQVRCCLRYS